ncbi:MAG: PEGA domain-containing protein, partial [Deltaproteobacteria bacterium]
MVRTLALLGLALAFLPASLWAAPARRVLVLASGPEAEPVRGAMALAAQDVGARLLARGRKARSVRRAARRCGGAVGCLTRLAGRHRLELWVSQIQSGRVGLDLTVTAIRHGGRVAEPARIAGLTPRDLVAAAYGTVYRGLGGKGTGHLDVVLREVDTPGEVRVEGKEVGTTPLRGLAVPAGSVWVDIRAEGFLPWRELVAIRPGETVKLAPVLQADVGEIELVALVPEPSEQATEPGPPEGEAAAEAGGTEEARTAAMASAGPASPDAASSETAGDAVPAT